MPSIESRSNQHTLSHGKEKNFSRKTRKLYLTNNIDKNRSICQQIVQKYKVTITDVIVFSTTSNLKKIVFKKSFFNIALKHPCYDQSNGSAGSINIPQVTYNTKNDSKVILELHRKPLCIFQTNWVHIYKEKLSLSIQSAKVKNWLFNFTEEVEVIPIYCKTVTFCKIVLKVWIKVTKW